MLPKNINTIAELQAEQDRLKAQIKLTRQEFFNSVGRTTTTGRNLLLKKVLLPAGAIGLGAVAAKKIFSAFGHDDGTEREEMESHSPGGGSHWFPKMMLVALPFLQQYFLKEKMSGQVEETTAQSAHHAAPQQSPFAQWALTLVPMLVPVLQQYFLKKTRTEEPGPTVVETKLAADGRHYEEVNVKQESASPIFEWLYKLLPVVLPLVQQYFLSRKVEEEQVG